MLRLIFVLAIVLLGCGCVDGSISPGKLPKGATAGVYTTAAPQAVAACIATVLGNTAQPFDDRLVIASSRHPGVSYSVGPNRGSDVYPTQIAIMGVDGDTEEAKSVSACSNASRPG